MKHDDGVQLPTYVLHVSLFQLDLGVQLPLLVLLLNFEGRQLMQRSSESLRSEVLSPLQRGLFSLA